MLRKSFYYVLLAVFVHSYTLFHVTDESRHNVARAFEINSSYQSYQYRPTSTALHQLKMSKPFPGIDIVVDHDRAQYCVDHFGSCTIAEMESLKNGMSVLSGLLP